MNTLPNEQAMPRSPRSFLNRLGAHLIYKIRGNDSTGRAAWYYLRVEPLKKTVFERESRKGQIQLTDYGTILMSGYGENPPRDVVRLAKEEFGFEE
jgi:hypothetical protein